MAYALVHRKIHGAIRGHLTIPHITISDGACANYISRIEWLHPVEIGTFVILGECHGPCIHMVKPRKRHITDMKKYTRFVESIRFCASVSKEVRFFYESWSEFRHELISPRLILMNKDAHYENLTGVRFLNNGIKSRDCDISFLGGATLSYLELDNVVARYFPWDTTTKCVKTDTLCAAWSTLDGTMNTWVDPESVIKFAYRPQAYNNGSFCVGREIEHVRGDTDQDSLPHHINAIRLHGLSTYVAQNMKNLRIMQIMLVCSSFSPEYLAKFFVDGVLPNLEEIRVTGAQVNLYQCFCGIDKSELTAESAYAVDTCDWTRKLLLCHIAIQINVTFICAKVGKTRITCTNSMEYSILDESNSQDIFRFNSGKDVSWHDLRICQSKYIHLPITARIRRFSDSIGCSPAIFDRLLH